MNERIKELAKQAGMRFDRFGMVIPTTLTVQENVNLEKFAELIVRECSGINYNSPFKDGEFHARELLERFGVE